MSNTLKICNLCNGVVVTQYNGPEICQACCEQFPPWKEMTEAEYEELEIKVRLIAAAERMLEAIHLPGYLANLEGARDELHKAVKAAKGKKATLTEGGALGY